MKMTIDLLHKRLEDLAARLAALEARAEGTVASDASLLGRMSNHEPIAPDLATGWRVIAVDRDTLTVTLKLEEAPITHQ